MAPGKQLQALGDRLRLSRAYPRARRARGIPYSQRRNHAGPQGGRDLGNGGDDFGWMDAWHVYEKGKVEQGASEGKPPKLKGDAIMAIKTESASGLIYWNGKKFDWYQQGD